MSKQTDKVSFQLSMGALSDRIEDQINAAGLEYVGKTELDALQICADAVTNLLIRGIITDSEAHRARKNIARRVSVKRIGPQS